MPIEEKNVNQLNLIRQHMEAIRLSSETVIQFMDDYLEDPNLQESIRKAMSPFRQSPRDAGSPASAGKARVSKAAKKTRSAVADIPVQKKGTPTREAMQQGREVTRQLRPLLLELFEENKQVTPEVVAQRAVDRAIPISGRNQVTSFLFNLAQRNALKRVKPGVYTLPATQRRRLEEVIAETATA